MLETVPLVGESTLSTSKTNCDAEQRVQTPLEDVSCFRFTYALYTSPRFALQMADFRHVANEATRGLVASEEKNREPAMCAEPYSIWRCTSLVILMVCFVAATPLSLVLTIPAYVLADRVSALYCSANTCSNTGILVPRHLASNQSRSNTLCSCSQSPNAACLLH